MTESNKPGEKKSGLDKVPKFVESPIYKDRIFWIGLGTALFWILLIWYFFFS
ncbi:MAG: hypothetical protein WBC71_05805 [Salaquimonas sp.]